MKKHDFIFWTALSAFSLMAFSFMYWTYPVSNFETKLGKSISCSSSDIQTKIGYQSYDEFFCDVNSRFNTKISLESLQKARTIFDIFPSEAVESRESFKNVRITVLNTHEESAEMGDSTLLNPAQLQFLQSVDYSNNIRISALCKIRNSYDGFSQEDSIVYYITTVPEKQCEYMPGQEALLKHIKEKTKLTTAFILLDKLQPGKISFTVSKNGEVKNSNLLSTSGYPSIDKAMIKLINELPERWKPATNAQGEAVDQKLVFFFGQIGC